MIHTGNIRSVRVAEAIGSVFERPYELFGMPCAIYGQDRPC